MRCPHCGHPDTSVIETREADASVRRRRECRACRERFTTYERYERPAGRALIVLGNGGGRRVFSRNWLAGALVTAGAELPDAALRSITGNVEAQLKARGSSMISTADLALLVAQEVGQNRPRGGGRKHVPTAEQVGAILDASCAAQLPLPLADTRPD
ncbi:MAG TPA: transcriptional regulator NrdR [Chloroflexota bacterium]|jgi:transcriptional repressor NrdR|nr:transcriptional regulator NrdR [Chloroflexota bacterium]